MTSHTILTGSHIAIPELLKTTGKIMRHPIAAVKTLYQQTVTENGMKSLFADRNQLSVVKPFLDTLGCEYLRLTNGLVLVNYDDQIHKRLIELGFNKSSEVFPKTPFFRHQLAITNKITTRRLYQTDYNVEIHLVDQWKWDIAKTAQKVTNALPFHEDEYLSKYLIVFKTLLNERIDNGQLVPSFVSISPGRLSMAESHVNQIP